MVRQIMQFNHQTINYKVAGNGFPLIFLHGFCEDLTLWEPFVEPFGEYQIVLIDLMGFGGSEVPKEATINYLAKAVKAILNDLKIEKCLMIGHSMGGYTTLAFAELFPELLSGICLFHSHPFADSDIKKFNRRKTIDFINKYGTRPFLKQMIPSLFHENYRKENTILINKMIDRAASYDKNGIISALEAMINRPDRSDILKNLNIPVLMIIGQQDEAVPYIDSLKMAHLAKVSDIQILEEVGHVGMLETPQKTQNILHNFIQFALQTDFYIKK